MGPLDHLEYVIPGKVLQLVIIIEGQQVPQFISPLQIFGLHNKYLQMFFFFCLVWFLTTIIL